MGGLEESCPHGASIVTHHGSTPAWLHPLSASIAIAPCIAIDTEVEAANIAYGGGGVGVGMLGATTDSICLAASLVDAATSSIGVADSRQEEG